MIEKRLWFCSIAVGVPYTAIRCEFPVFPVAKFGKERSILYASCSIRSIDPPTYQRMQIEFEDATGVVLPPMKKGTADATD